MTGSLPGFGGQGYITQESRALSSIERAPGLSPDGDGQEQYIKLLQSHDYQIKFLAREMKKAQQGINDATQNPIQQIQGFIADIIILFGGGELAQGALDFGDLQYILPALGALFGFGDGPFPFSLFDAAQKFFFGYVVPQQQFVDVIIKIITAWAGVFGINPKFIKDASDLVQAISDLFGGVANLFPSLNELFAALGLTDANGAAGGALGPLGQLLAPIIRLFTGIDLRGFGTIFDFIFGVIDPFITGLTGVINWINGILAVLGFHGGSVINSPLDLLLAPFYNLWNFLGQINFGIAGFNPIVAAQQFINTVLNPAGILATLDHVGDMIGTATQALLAGIQGTLTGLGNDIGATAANLGNLVHTLLTNAAAALGPIPRALVTGLEGVLDGIWGGINLAGSFIQNVINTIWSSIRGLPIVGGFVPGLPDLGKAVNDQQVKQQNFTISAIVSDYRNPNWVCRYPIADVSFPEYMLNKADVFGETDTASIGTAHTHSLSTSNNVFTQAGGRSIAVGACRGVYITVSNTTPFDGVLFSAWRAAGTFTGTVTCAVFRERDDGSVYQIFSQDITALLGTGTTIIDLDFPELIIAQAGEQYMVRIHNGSSVPIFVQAIQESTGAQQQAFYYAAAPLSSATEYTAAQCVTARANGTFVSWTGLRMKNMPETDRSYSDDANRGAIGGLWFRKSSTAAQLDIYDEQFGYTGNTDGSQSAIYIHPTNRKGSRVEANLYFNPASTARQGVLLHCNRSLSQIVYLGVDGSTAKIFSGSYLALTERASLNVGGDGLWGVYYDEALDRFVALKNGEDVGLKWNSVGSAVQHGSDFNYGGLRVEMVGAQPSGTIDNWTLRDWLIAVPVSLTAGVMQASATMGNATLTAGVELTATAMTAIATMPSAELQAGVALTTAAMQADATMPDADMRISGGFPTTFPHYFPID